LLASVQASLALRHSEPALRSDEVAIVGATGAALAFRRGAAADVAVAVNAGDESVRLEVGRGAGGTVLLGVARAGSVAPSVRTDEYQVSIEMPPRSGAVVRIG
jgi:hypothetical protein